MSTEVVDHSDPKLRVIFATIEEQNYRQAVQLVNKASKRNPTMLIWKALKAMCYYRLGREEDASQLCAEVVRATPTDLTILQTISAIYKGWQMYGEICQAYSKACKLKPSDEELASQLFMALVRNDDYKGQQQVALQMHKRFRTSVHCDKYLFWAVMSMVLQSKTDSMGHNSLSLTLAERMMSKVLEDGGIRSYEEMQLFLLVFRAQNKYSDALILLESQLGEQFKVQGEINRCKLELLAKLERWSEAEQLAKQILKHDADDWHCYTCYLDALFKRLMGEASESRWKDELTSARAFLKSAMKDDHNDDLKRGPFMAELELLKRASEIGINNEGTDLVFLEYFERFSSKTCCFDDIRPYITLAGGVSDDTVDSLLRELRMRLKDDDKVKHIQKHLNYLKIEQYLRCHEFDTDEEVERFANEMLKFYTDALQYGKDLVETEKQYGDDYVILAVHVMVSAHCRTGNASWLFNALSLLEHASSKSIHNFQFKLLLIRLYQKLGMISRPIDIFRSMDIKQIQLDTMSHFLLHDLPDLGYSDKAQIEFCRTLQFYRSADVECPDMITQAYKYGTYSHVDDFVEFRRRILHSLPRAVALMEIRKLGFLQASTLEEIQLHLLDIAERENRSDAVAADMVDNRDFGVMVDWSNESGCAIEKSTRSRPRKTHAWLSLHCKSFKLLAIMLSLRLSADVTVSSLVEAMAALRQSMEATAFEENLTVEEMSNLHIVLASAELLVVAMGEGSQDDLQKRLNGVFVMLSSHLSQITEGTKSGKIDWTLFHKITTFVEALQIVKVLRLSVHEHTSRSRKGNQNISASVRGLKALIDSALKEEDFVEKFKGAMRHLKQASKEIGKVCLRTMWTENMAVASEKVSAGWVDYSVAADNFTKLVQESVC